jgi:hypothetical protein
MNSGIGIIGALLLAVGGVMITLSTCQLLLNTFNYSGLFGFNTSVTLGSMFVDFTGFFVLGLGLWFIVQSGKHETSPTQSVQQPLPQQ